MKQINDTQTKALKLEGFNNLTKTLSFNLYELRHVATRDARAYRQHIDRQYSTIRLTAVCKKIAGLIGANILNLASQEYDPQGASVTLLISEEGADPGLPASSKTTAIAAHLDKSHIAVHTYPEIDSDRGICTFRADLDISTCGCISPLKTLAYLFHTFPSEVVIIDYRIRGFTRDLYGKKYFRDHPIDSIQAFIPQQAHTRYYSKDSNLSQENFFHTKMIQRRPYLTSMLFHREARTVDRRERAAIRKQLRQEMMELFHGNSIQPAQFIGTHD